MKKLNIINLTPHDVVLINAAGAEIIFCKSNNPVRVVETSIPQAGREINDGIVIPTISSEWGEIENLPEREDDTMYIVSSIVAAAATEIGRDDILVPADFIRNETGMIVGCKAFRSFQKK